MPLLHAQNVLIIVFGNFLTSFDNFYGLRVNHRLTILCLCGVLCIYYGRIGL